MKKSLSLIGILLLAASILAPAYAQTTLPNGIIAFVGLTDGDQANVFVLELATGRIGRLNAQVTPDVDLAWRPGDNVLAFTTSDGGYGLLRSLAGCFATNNICQDTSVFALPGAVVQNIAWTADGNSLYLQTDQGLKQAPVTASSADDLLDLGMECAAGFAAAGDAWACAVADAAGNITVNVHDAADGATRYTLGSYPAITSLAIGGNGRAVVGTLEALGDSGFFATVDGEAQRLASHQIHVYDAAFDPDAAAVGIVGAIADSTGDGTLRDGDIAELLRYDTQTNQLEQIAAFTGATGLAWSPDGAALLVISEDQRFAVYMLAASSTTPVNVPLPQPYTRAVNPVWNTAQVSLPAVPTATLGQLPLPTSTTPPTLTPWATITPRPTLTPFPTFTPWPSATPGSPLGTGCEYARNPQIVAVGDVVAVTSTGAAVRLRAYPNTSGTLLQELATGTRMTVLSGPSCADGYRWWQVQLETGGMTGYLADSYASNYWIERAPTAPTETITFLADRYSITPGECVSIYWLVEGIREVHYQGIGVTGNESRLECPLSTTTYTLRIVRSDYSEVIRTVTVAVSTAY